MRWIKGDFIRPSLFPKGSDSANKVKFAIAQGSPGNQDFNVIGTA